MEKERKKREEEQRKIEEDRRDCALQMEQLAWERNLNLELYEKKRNDISNGASVTSNSDSSLAEFLSADPNSDPSNWWCGSNNTQPMDLERVNGKNNDSDRCYYCKRFNCIGFQHNPGINVEDDIFQTFEKEMLERKGSAWDRKEMRAHITTRFRQHLRLEVTKDNRNGMITHCGLPFCLVVRILQKYTRRCSTCNQEPCVFYRHFRDVFPDCMAMMHSCGRSPQAIRNFLIAFYAHNKNDEGKSNGHVYCGHDSDGDSVFADDEGAVSFYEADDSSLPRCTSRMIEIAFP